MSPDVIELVLAGSNAIGGRNGSGGNLLEEWGSLLSNLTSITLEGEAGILAPP